MEKSLPQAVFERWLSMPLRVILTGGPANSPMVQDTFNQLLQVSQVVKYFVLKLLYFINNCFQAPRFKIMRSSNPEVSVPLGTCVLAAALMTAELLNSPFSNFHQQRLAHLNYNIRTANSLCRELRFPWGECSTSHVVIYPEFLPIIRKGVCFIKIIIFQANQTCFTLVRTSHPRLGNHDCHSKRPDRAYV